MCFSSLFQLGENEPFVSELLTTLPTTIVDLEPHQIHTFYESVSTCGLQVIDSKHNSVMLFSKLLMNSEFVEM